MSKNRFLTGQPIFTQLLSFIPNEEVFKLAKEYKTDRYAKKFTVQHQLVTMLYAAFHRCSSLREVITGMQVNSEKLRHFGLTCTPRRSTLSDANSRIDSGFFEKLYQVLLAKYYPRLPDSRLGKKDRDRLFIIDSTTITLFSDVMRGVGLANASGKRKGGVKAHTLIDAKHDVPSYVFLSEARYSDRLLFAKLPSLPPGSIVVMDKGYNSYEMYAEWTKSGITWVTRINERAVWRTVFKKSPTWFQKKRGVINDRIIELGRPDLSHDETLKRVRLITFYDQKTKRQFEFISNDLKCSPLRIAQLYKDRWQIESLFKRLKSNFQFRYFLGDNENAIKIQIWCSLIADLLVKIVQDKVKNATSKTWSFANIAGLIRHHLATYVDLMKFLANPDLALIHYRPPNPIIQIRLF